MLIPTLGLTSLETPEGRTPVWKTNVYRSDILGLNGARVDTDAIAFGALQRFRFHGHWNPRTLSHFSTFWNTL